MFLNKLRQIFTLILFLYCNTKLSNTMTSGDTSYVVYLIEMAEQKKMKYDTWLCGGAILSENYILTSAACVMDVKDIYAVAGYKYYVKASELNNDECTKNTKRRIVHTMTPDSYKFGYEPINVWSQIDISIVQVDFPYDFSDEIYGTLCSYYPKPIRVSFAIQNQQPEKLAKASGWGSLQNMRSVNNTNDENEKTIKTVHLTIIEKPLCTAAYKLVPAMKKVITNYMLCADTGINKEETLHQMDYGEDATQNPDLKNTICQNDHGSPLVTNDIVNDDLVVIGVTSVFRVTTSGECRGPYLFTSIRKLKNFVECVLNGTLSMCDYTNFNIVRRNLKWAGYTERHREPSLAMRPQLSLNNLNGNYG